MLHLYIYLDIDLYIYIGLYIKSPSKPLLHSHSKHIAQPRSRQCTGEILYQVLYILNSNTNS